MKSTAEGRGCMETGYFELKTRGFHAAWLRTCGCEVQSVIIIWVPLRISHTHGASDRVVVKYLPVTTAVRGSGLKPRLGTLYGSPVRRAGRRQFSLVSL